MAPRGLLRVPISQVVRVPIEGCEGRAIRQLEPPYICLGGVGWHPLHVDGSGVLVYASEDEIPHASQWPARPGSPGRAAFERINVRFAVRPES